jgi:hypothetical protein
MRNPPAGYKHSDPSHLDFGKTADSTLLAKRRQNLAGGGEVSSSSGDKIDPIDEDLLRVLHSGS